MNKTKLVAAINETRLDLCVREKLLVRFDAVRWFQFPFADESRRGFIDERIYKIPRRCIPSGDSFDSWQVVTEEECARDSSKYGRRWIYFLERGFNPRATWIRVSFSFNFRFCCSDALATTLSALYGKLLVVMGIAFPMAEVISTYIPPSFYEAFYLYLYFGSMIFLVYMYAMLFGDNKTKPSESRCM